MQAQTGRMPSPMPAESRSGCSTQVRLVCGWLSQHAPEVLLNMVQAAGGWTASQHGSHVQPWSPTAWEQIMMVSTGNHQSPTSGAFIQFSRTYAGGWTGSRGSAPCCLSSHLESGLWPGLRGMSANAQPSLLCACGYVWPMHASPSPAGAAAGGSAQQWRPALCACRQHQRPSRPGTLRIYEAHVGMSSEEPAVASYTYFKGERSPELHSFPFHVCDQSLAKFAA